MTYNLLAVSGSLRKASYNTALLRAFKELAPEGASVEITDIHGLPVFNQDDEKEHFPALATELKEKIRAADGILISTPEYNRGMSGALKNFLDYTSRPYGDNAWALKPVYVVGASVGPIAAALAQYNVKQVLTYLDARLLGQPEFYLGTAGEKFDAEGNLTDEKTKEHIKKAYDVFLPFIEKLK